MHRYGEMRRWYDPRDVTGFDGEIVIPESESVEQIVSIVVKGSGL